MGPTQIWPTPFLLTTTNKIGGILLNFQFALLKSPSQFSPRKLLEGDWGSSITVCVKCGSIETRVSKEEQGATITTRL